MMPAGESDVATCVSRDLAEFLLKSRGLASFPHLLATIESRFPCGVSGFVNGCTFKFLARLCSIHLMLCFKNLHQVDRNHLLHVCGCAVRVVLESELALLRC